MSDTHETPDPTAHTCEWCEQETATRFVPDPWTGGGVAPCCDECDPNGPQWDEGSDAADAEDTDTPGPAFTVSGFGFSKRYPPAPYLPDEEGRESLEFTNEYAANGYPQRDADPLGWFTRAGVEVNPDEDEVNFYISTGEPRGAITITARRLPDGRIIISGPDETGQPHEDYAHERERGRTRWTLTRTIPAAGDEGGNR